MPFHDKRPLELVLRFAKQLKPDGVVLNGDIVDCYSISSHRVDPEEMTKSGLSTEIDLAAWLMSQFKGVKERVWIGGNHESRLYRYVTDKAPLLGLLPSIKFPKLFQLEKYGFGWRDYGETIRLGKLLITHGSMVRQHSAYTAKSHFDKYGMSVLIGHTHRLGVYTHTNIKGAHGAWENGCLCRLDGLGYVFQPDWQQGFSVVHVHPKGYFNVQQIPIINGNMFFYGKEVWGG